MSQQTRINARTKHSKATKRKQQKNGKQKAENHLLRVAAELRRDTRDAARHRLLGREVDIDRRMMIA
jgi:hypothetical protein